MSSVYIRYPAFEQGIPTYPLLAPNGTTSAPSYSFINSTGTGMFLPSGNVLEFVTNGTLGLQIDSSQNSTFGGILKVPTSVVFLADSSTGINLGSGNSLQLVGNAVQSLRLNGTSISSQLPFFTTDGSANIPSYSFNNSQTCGFFLISANSIGFSTNSTQQLQIDTAKIISALPFQAPDGAANAPGFAIGSLTNGLYKFATNSLGFTTAGVTAGNISATQGWTISGTLAVSGATTITNTVDIKGGGSTGTIARAGGRLNTEITNVSNTTTGETTLHTYTVPATTLATAGDRVIIEAAGTFAGTANNKTVTVYFGSTTWAIGPFAFNNTNWFARLVCARASSNVQRLSGTWNSSDTLQTSTCFSGVSTQTDTSTIVVKVTGTGGATNDIVGRYWAVDFLPG
jgi:hypothetical protein